MSISFGGMGALESPFQLLSFTASPRSKLSARSEKSRRVVHLVASLFLLSFSLLGFGVTNANAVGIATCSTLASSWTSPTANRIPYSTNYIWPFPDWSQANTVPSYCVGYATTWYNDQVQKKQSQFVSGSITSFSSRLNSCMKGQSPSIWNPASYINLVRCSFVVAFIPSSQVMKNSLNDTMNTINTHVPLSFVSLGVNVATTMTANWSFTSCTDSLSTLRLKLLSAPNYSTAQNLNSAVNVVIPCQPVDPSTGKPLAYIQQLRYLMLTPMYVFLMWWLLKVGINFVHRIQS